jgi:hypothetical protein
MLQHLQAAEDASDDEAVAAASAAAAKAVESSRTGNELLQLQERETDLVRAKKHHINIEKGMKVCIYLNSACTLRHD